MVAADALRRPRTADVVVGTACVAVAVALLLLLPVLTSADSDAASLVLPSPSSTPWWLLVLAFVAQGAVLAWSGRGPAAALVTAAAVAFAVSWARAGSAYGLSNLAVVVAVVLTVIAAPRVALRFALPVAGLLIAAGGTVNGIRAESLAPTESVLAALVQSLGVIGLPYLVGAFVRGRRDVDEARRAEFQARLGERDAQVMAAVARERTAMARELHDIAAHHLSGIALMAAVVDRQIDKAPADAHRGVQQVRAQSTMVLDDLRRLVGLLRDEPDGGRSLQALTTVPELVERARGQGAVELTVRTADDRTLGAGIGPLAQLAAYRTIQEALTNAAAHAPGASRVVEIDDRDDGVAVIRVTNAAPNAPGHRSPSGGFGLVGMQERADLVGADLSFGPTGAGGWHVRVVIPREVPGRSRQPRHEDAEADA